MQVETLGDKSIQYKTHPNINRGLWAEENVLSHRFVAASEPCAHMLILLDKFRNARVHAILNPTKNTYIHTWASVDKLVHC